MAKGSKAHVPEDDKPKIIAHVLAELASGVPISRTLGANREPWLCSNKTFWNWYFVADPEDPDSLIHKVARAREAGIEAKMDEAMHVAATPMLGEIVTEKPILVDGKPLKGVTIREVKREDMLGHRKLLVDTIHKQAQMLKPKTYGPKLDLTSGGEKLALSAELEAARKRAAD